MKPVDKSQEFSSTGNSLGLSTIAPFHLERRHALRRGSLDTAALHDPSVHIASDLKH
jgi:hypothetical protein